jgi:hypothetical protein
MDSAHMLPDNMYSLPEIKRTEGSEDTQGGMSSEANGQQKGMRKTWGPVLVENRPSRRPVDGRTILEQAQERKKVVNQETRKIGNKPSNSFSILSQSEIVSTSKSVGIKLGSNSVEVEKTISEIQDIDWSRRSSFVDDYSTRKEDKVSEMAVGEENEMLMSSTSVEMSVPPQVEDSVEPHGQWTRVANRKKSKPKLHR